jgi:hypothetical protein
VDVISPPELKNRGGGFWPGATHCGGTGTMVLSQSTWNFQAGVPDLIFNA